MVKCFRKSFSLSDLWVTSHERLSDFYLTSWQRGDSAVPMLVLRMLLAVITMSIFVWSIATSPTPYWLIYLTNWGLLLVTLLTLSATLVSLLAVCQRIPDGGPLPWYVSMYWLFYNTTITVAIIITGLYWILLYNPEQEEEDDGFWLDLATHGFNSCVAFVEIVMSRTPLRLLHIYQPLGVGLWYAAFSGIYYAAGGTDGMGNPFIYEILDWRQAGRASIIVAVSAASLIVVYALLWGVTLCRDRVSTSLIRTTSLELPFVPPDRHSPSGMV
ncbi:protein rolling stone-like [Pararge aegeria]|uniref:Jg19475 protein n=1 Tax=Pararge aegeria aegeria TaxID=348720 RepID=A0A8S4R8Z7_9NEOP|nr:protein rolling stone-like [Pararge aegeria]XP_039756539.1 protein rolling stone-like [Pararge aegeria]XP_039756547.1 protein rolling stone-like [Pararge aegeria]CAH2231656.1 jg19475 [Pararge aegeria aegeria]